MNALPRTRALVAGLGALALLTLGACSSADSDQASSSVASTTSSVAQSVSDDAVSDSNVIPPATTDPSAPDSYTEVAPSTELPSAAAPATTEVPAPGGGNINETVAESTLATNAPVAVTKTADYGNGVTASLAKVEKITTTAELPGEIAGPGVALTVQIVNGGSEAIDLSTVLVNLVDAAGAPALPMSAAPAAPMTGSLDPGATATGVYVFTLSQPYSDPSSIEVSYSVDAPVVVFTGNVS